MYVHVFHIVLNLVFLMYIQQRTYVQKNQVRKPFFHISQLQICSETNYKIIDFSTCETNLKEKPLFIIIETKKFFSHKFKTIIFPTNLTTMKVISVQTEPMCDKTIYTLSVEVSFILADFIDFFFIIL